MQYNIKQTSVQLYSRYNRIIKYNKKLVNTKLFGEICDLFIKILIFDKKYETFLNLIKIICIFLVLLHILVDSIIKKL
jgi:hypothetical protein